MLGHSYAYSNTKITVGRTCYWMVSVNHRRKLTPFREPQLKDIGRKARTQLHQWVSDLSP